MLKAICLPSGEKWALDSVPGKLVRRLASPPSRLATQMSPAYANAICVLLTVGCRSRRVPCADARMGQHSKPRTTEVYRIVYTTVGVPYASPPVARRLG